jgi:hypothetical protein
MNKTTTKAPKQAKTTASSRPTQTRFAMADPALMGTSLFRPLQRGSRNSRMVEINTEHRGRRLRIVSAYMLGADDLSMFLAILGLAGLLGKRLDTSRDSHLADVLNGLDVRWSDGAGEEDFAAAVEQALGDTFLRLTTTTYELIREAGLADAGDAYHRCLDVLQRLRGVYYIDFGPEGTNARQALSGPRQNLIGFGASEGDGGRLRIILNSRFAGAILGSQFSRIDLTEARQLGEVARILHTRLSVWIRPGASWQAAVDTMARWVYGDEAPTDAAKRKRRSAIRKALAEIGALSGWQCFEDKARAVVRVARPQAGRNMLQQMLPIDPF